MRHAYWIIYPIKLVAWMQRLLFPAILLAALALMMASKAGATTYRTCERWSDEGYETVVMANDSTSCPFATRVAASVSRYVAGRIGFDLHSRVHFSTTVIRNVYSPTTNATYRMHCHIYFNGGEYPYLDSECRGGVNAYVHFNLSTFGDPHGDG